MGKCVVAMFIFWLTLLVVWHSAGEPVIEAEILESGLRKYMDEKEHGERERIMANLDAESERMEAEGYAAGLAGRYRVVPRPCSCAGENAWNAGWRRGRVDGGHWVP